MKLTLKSEHLKANMEFTDDVHVSKLIMGMIQLLEAQGYMEDSIYREMGFILQKQYLCKESANADLPLILNEKRLPGAIFEFADGTTMTKGIWEVVRGLYKHGESGSMRPVKVTFIEDFTTLEGKVEEQLYGRWKASCYEALDTKAREALNDN